MVVEEEREKRRGGGERNVWVCGAVQFNGGVAADCDSSDSHGYGGHSLGMMSCKGNLGAWEVRGRGGGKLSLSHRGHSKLTSLPASGPNPFLLAQERLS